MATFAESNISLGTASIRAFVVDYSNDLLTGVTVSSGTAIHIPPYGTASTVSGTFGTTAGTVTVGPLPVLGIHYIDVTATLSDGEKSVVRIAFAVNFPETAARSGMFSLVADLRQYTNAGLNDYSIAEVPYWSDKQLQDILDHHKLEIKEQPLEAEQEWTGTGAGSAVFKEYYVGAGNLEQGTANFKVFDSNGSALPGTMYSADYTRGEITFVNDQMGSARFITAYSYDLNASAADVWRRKMSYYATAYDISTDGNSMKRSQLIQQCKLMADYYSSQQEINSAFIGRSDDVTY
jgi:hypothetical protein